MMRSSRNWASHVDWEPREPGAREDQEPRARPLRCRASGASDDPATELDIL